MIDFGDPVPGSNPLDGGRDEFVNEQTLDRDRGDIAVDGIVVDAANAERGLGGISSIDSELAVSSAVNNLDSLNSVDGNGVEHNADEVRRIIDGTDNRFSSLDSASQIASAEGFSARADVSGTESVLNGDDTGQFVVNTYIRDRVLFVEAYDTIDASSGESNISEFIATLADGRPLPEWISFTKDGVFMIDRPADVEAVTLKITGLRDGADDITRVLEIDTPTGEIREHQSSDQAFGRSFSQALESTSGEGEQQT